MITRLVILSLLASLVAVAQPGVAPVPERLVPAAQAFLNALTPELRAQAVLPFNSEERLNWHYFPKDRPGIPWAAMGEAQKAAAVELLKASLSDAGYTKAEEIRALENVLREMEGSAHRDENLYYFTFFGEPSTDSLWGLRYEGHHLSLNWTFSAGKTYGDTPQFLGANPADVHEGSMAGTGSLAAEEDLARALVKGLPEEQRAAAVLNATAPPEILTGADREAVIQEDSGLAYANMDEASQGMLLSLIQEYAACQPSQLAQARLEKIRAAGMEQVKFAWMGGLEKGQGHYYRIQGPTFLIEYDNTQNDADHVHTVWRDFEGDFGRDLLKEHYAAHAGQPGSPHTH